MKKIFLLIGASTISLISFSQNQDNIVGPTGNIGVGTLAPTVELEVAGEMKLTNMSDISLLATDLRFLVITKDGKLMPGDLITEYVRVNGAGGGASNGGSGGGNSNYCYGNGARNINWTVNDDDNVFICPNGYNFGIGTITPTEKLHVTGKIYSSTGGFKFPDNTTQITAYKPEDFDYVGGELRIPDGPGGSYRALTINASGGSVWSQSGTVTYYNSGNVGIGTSNPTEKLTLVGNAKITGNISLTGDMLLPSFGDIVNFNNGAASIGMTTNGSNVIFRNYAGNNSYQISLSGSGGGQKFYVTSGSLVPLQVQRLGEVNVGVGAVVPAGFGVGLGQKVYSSDDIQLATSVSLEDVDSKGYGQKLLFENRTGTSSDAWIARRFEDFGATEIRVKMGSASNSKFAVGSGGGFDSKFSVLADGQVFIGNEVALNKDYKLAVDGKIVCTEVLVDLVNDWPDYVFSNDYKLNDLNDVEKYIEENNHLPGVPSAEEVKEDGIELGEMNRVLLEKVEELTLYLIEIEKKNKELEQRLIEVEKK